MQNPESWLYAKTCSLCQSAVGHGKFRPKKLQCRQCLRAVCPNCSTSTPSGLVCKQCGGEPVEIRQKELAAEEVLASAKAILADIRAKQPEANTGDSGLVEKYKNQIAAFDTEIQDLKKHIDWYAEQLDQREQTIADMRSKVTGLTANNEELSTRIKQLEESLSRIQVTPPVTSERACLRCSLL